MNKELENSIKENGYYITTTDGDSMYPMLKSGTTVLIKAPIFPLKKCDIPVYRFEDHYVMHRIVWAYKDKYVICGDNRDYLEKNIRAEDIVGILDGYYLGDDFIDSTSKIFISYGKKALIRLPIKIFKGKIKKKFKKLQ